MTSFIVLHYKNIEETLTCLEKLRKLNGDISIVVVDNNTLDSNQEKKLKKYTTDILKLEDNMGFAKANNKGIEYARKKYDSAYYFVINNDVFISDVDILTKIRKRYEACHFDILGPYIDSPTKESVNPFPAIIGKENIEKEITKCQQLIKIYNSAFLTKALETYIKIKHIFRKPCIPTNGKELKKNVALHGCAIVFSKKYIKAYEYPFFNETFLFHEEEFLYKRVVEDNLISVYDPEIKVFHKEGSSIQKSEKSKRNSKLFREKERLKSLKMLLEEYERKEVNKLN